MKGHLEWNFEPLNSIFGQNVRVMTPHNRGGIMGGHNTDFSTKNAVLGLKIAFEILGGYILLLSDRYFHTQI